MTDITKSILAINPKAEVSVDADDIKKITWHNGTTPIAEADILAKQKELQTTYDNNSYQRKRVDSYAELGEQLDQLYHDMAADKGDKTGEWFKAVKKVKDDNPKEPS